MRDSYGYGCFTFLGLVFIAGGIYIAYWANYVMESPDMEAPFVATCGGICCCLPLALVFFLLGSLGSRTASPPTEISNKLGDGAFKWSSDDENGERDADEPGARLGKDILERFLELLARFRR